MAIGDIITLGGGAKYLAPIKAHLYYNSTDFAPNTTTSIYSVTGKGRIEVAYCYVSSGYTNSYIEVWADGVKLFEFGRGWVGSVNIAHSDGSRMEIPYFYGTSPMGYIGMRDSGIGYSTPPAHGISDYKGIELLSNGIPFNSSFEIKRVAKSITYAMNISIIGGVEV